MAWLRFLANHRIDICIPRKRHRHDETVVAMAQPEVSGYLLSESRCPSLSAVRAALPRNSAFDGA
jgi:hypothetical protein